MRLTVVRALLAMLCISIGSSAAAGEQAIEAIWKSQHASFVYTGTTTIYTCRELESKLKRVLRTLGAHDDIIIDRTACSEGHVGQLHVRFRSPVPATADNVRSATTYAPTQQLVARLNEEQLPSAQDLLRFAATWQEVSFARHPSMRMDPSDCQFVEDVRRQMLPRFAATVTVNRLFCTPGYPSIGRPRLSVRVLLASSSAKP